MYQLTFQIEGLGRWRWRNTWASTSLVLLTDFCSLESCGWLENACKVFMVDLVARKANEIFWQSPPKHHKFAERQYVH